MTEREGADEAHAERRPIALRALDGGLELGEQVGVPAVLFGRHIRSLRRLVSRPDTLPAVATALRAAVEKVAMSPQGTFMRRERSGS